MLFKFIFKATKFINNVLFNKQILYNVLSKIYYIFGMNLIIEVEIE